MNGEEFRLFIACKMRGSEESSFESSFGGREKCDDERRRGEKHSFELTVTRTCIWN
jgi:hypothetical protein